VLRELPGGGVLFDRANPSTTRLRSALQNVERDKGILAALRTTYLLGVPIPPEEQTVVDAARAISRFNRFRLNPYNLASPSNVPDLSAEAAYPPRIGYDGDDLAACLYYLKEKKDPALEVIAEKIRKVEPSFGDFDFTFLGTDKIAFSVSFTDARGTVTAVRISSGLLLYIGLMVLVCSPNRPPVMMIEEPENGLTPEAIAGFYAGVRDLAFREQNGQSSQVLISSHSPFVICNAWNGQDREFIHQVKILDGVSLVRKFSDAIKDSGAVLQKSKDGELVIGLKTAAEVMSGRFA
jgi:predicted ATPase